MSGYSFLLPLITAGAVLAAPPYPGTGLPDMPEGVSDGFPVLAEHGEIAPLRADTTINVCVVKVGFLPDYTETTSGNGVFESDSQAVTDLMGQVEGYFTDVSGGKLLLNITQYPSGDGAYQLQHQMVYYGSNDKFGQGQCELFRDAVEASDPEIDFSRYGAVIILHRARRG